MHTGHHQLPSTTQESRYSAIKTQSPSESFWQSVILRLIINVGNGLQTGYWKKKKSSAHLTRFYFANWWTVIHSVNLNPISRPTFQFFSFLGAMAKVRGKKRQLRHVCPSVRLHGTTWLPLDGFLWNLICEYFSKICRENSSIINIRQE